MPGSPLRQLNGSAWSPRISCWRQWDGSRRRFSVCRPKPTMLRCTTTRCALPGLECVRPTVAEIAPGCCCNDIAGFTTAYSCSLLAISFLPPPTALSGTADADDHQTAATGERGEGKRAKHDFLAERREFRLGE